MQFNVLFVILSGSVPFNVQVVARIENIPWHEDLTSPETEIYRLITNNIRNNVSLIHCLKKLEPPGKKKTLNSSPWRLKARVLFPDIKIL